MRSATFNATEATETYSRLREILRLFACLGNIAKHVTQPHALRRITRETLVTSMAMCSGRTKVLGIGNPQVCTSDRYIKKRTPGI